VQGGRNGSRPIPVDWYSQERFERLMAAAVSRDGDIGQSRTVRDWAGQFQGFTGSVKRTQVMEEAGIGGRTKLADFFTQGGAINRRGIARLRSAMFANSTEIKPGKTLLPIPNSAASAP
jgi:hypothetical protein